MKLNVKVDPRILLMVNNALLLLIGATMFHLNRTWADFFAAGVSAVLVEMVMCKLFPRYNKFSFSDRFRSAMPAALSVVVLLRLEFAWQYAAISVVAILSKYFIKDKYGKHIFNPSNFAIIFAYSVLPADAIRIDADQFSLNLLPILSCLILGLYATFLAKRWIIPVTYLVIMFAMSLLAEAFTSYGVYEVFGPEVGAVGILYLFFMVTDPKTTPNSYIGQFVFSLAMVGLTLTLRYNEVLLAHFVALFVVCPVYNSLKDFSPKFNLLTNLFGKKQYLSSAPQ